MIKNLRDELLEKEDSSITVTNVLSVIINKVDKIIDYLNEQEEFREKQRKEFDEQWEKIEKEKK